MKPTTCRWTSFAAFAAAMLTGSGAQAQAPSIFHISGEWISRSTVVPPEGLGNFTASPEIAAEVATFGVGFNVPIRLSDRVLLMPGAAYDLLAWNPNVGGIDPLDFRDFHALSLSVLLNLQLSPKWGLLFRIEPKLAGDFVDVGEEHFRFEGMALASYAFSERFSLSGGVLVTSQFGTVRPFPAVRVKWNIADNLRFVGLFPVQASLVWRLEERVELGLSGTVRGQLYAMTSQPVQQGRACPSDSGEEPTEGCFDSVAYSRAEVGATVGVRVASSLWLSFHAGFPVFRRVEFFNDGEGVEGGDADVDSNLLLQTRLELRIPGT